MSDDIREREPARDRADDPAQEGLRSDHAGTSSGLPAPAPPQPDVPAERPLTDRASSGGSGDGQAPAGEDPRPTGSKTPPEP